MAKRKSTKRRTGKSQSKRQSRVPGSKRRKAAVKKTVSKKRKVAKRKNSKKKLKVIILGGRGFVGRALSKHLSGCEVYTFDRHHGESNHLRGSLLQVSDLKQAFQGMDVVVNLVGLTPLRKPKGVSYQDVHITGVKNVIEAAEFCKVKRVVYNCALGADPSSSNSYLRTKAEGALLFRRTKIPSVIFNPSVILDKENELIRQLLFFSLFRSYPHMKNLIQPIYREDMAELLAMGVKGEISKGMYDVAGPDVISFYDLARKVYATKHRLCLPVPMFFVKLGLFFIALFHIMGFTFEQYRMLSMDNIVEENDAELFLQLTSLDEMLAGIEL